jgi:hypothetical protein
LMATIGHSQFLNITKEMEAKDITRATSVLRDERAVFRRKSQ